MAPWKPVPLYHLPIHRISNYYLAQGPYKHGSFIQSGPLELEIPQGGRLGTGMLREEETCVYHPLCAWWGSRQFSRIISFRCTISPWGEYYYDDVLNFTDRHRDSSFCCLLRVTRLASWRSRDWMPSRWQNPWPDGTRFSLILWEIFSLPSPPGKRDFLSYTETKQNTRGLIWLLSNTLPKTHKATLTLRSFFGGRSLPIFCAGNKNRNISPEMTRIIVVVVNGDKMGIHYDVQNWAFPQAACHKNKGFNWKLSKNSIYIHTHARMCYETLFYRILIILSWTLISSLFQ